VIITLIRLAGCVTKDSFDEYEKIFWEAFASLEIDESIAYKSQFGDAMPVIGGIMTGKIILWCVQAVVIGGFLWLVYILFKRLGVGMKLIPRAIGLFCKEG
jgi:hypothetical protein